MNIEPALRLLMPSAGRKVALMRALEPYFKVYPAGLHPRESASCCLAARTRFVELPLVNSSEYREALLAAIERIGIDVVLPVRNEDMDALAWMRLDLSAAGAKLIMSPTETLAHCLDKLALFRKLSRHHLPTPYTVLASQWRDLPEDPFPLFVKERFGSGSRLAQMVRTPEELGAILIHHNPEKLVVQPFLKGEEYTADMFFDLDGVLKQCVLRRRLAVLNGQMDAGEVVSPLAGSSFHKVSHIGDFFAFAGPINVQFIKVEDACYITDVNPRFSGGVGLTIAAGADFPAYLAQMVSGQEIVTQPVQVGTKATSYMDYVYG